MALTAEEIRSRSTARRLLEPVEVPDLGGEILVQALCASDLLLLEHKKRKALIEGGDPEDCAFEYIARSWVDAERKPLLPIEDGIALARSLDKPSYGRLVVKIAKLNGLTDADIDEAEKN